MHEGSRKSCKKETCENIGGHSKLKRMMDGRPRSMS